MWGAQNQTDSDCYRSSLHSLGKKNNSGRRVWSYNFFSYSLTCACVCRITLNEKMIEASKSGLSTTFRVKSVQCTSSPSALLNLQSHIFFSLLHFRAFNPAPASLTPPLSSRSVGLFQLLAGLLVRTLFHLNTVLGSTCGAAAWNCSLTCFAHNLTQHIKTDTLRWEWRIRPTRFYSVIPPFSMIQNQKSGLNKTLNTNRNNLQTE